MELYHVAFPLIFSEARFSFSLLLSSLCTCFSTAFYDNIKNYFKYSEKFTIHVLDLTQVHLTDRADKNHDLDKWAKLFRALTREDYRRTWEGVKQEMDELRSSNEEKDNLIASLEAQVAELQMRLQSN